MKRLLQRLWAMRKSLLGFVATLALAFISLGYSSLTLYVVATPVLNAFYPPLSEWRGPWVWPVLVGVTIVFAPSFLVAGACGQWLEARGWPNGRRRLAYLVVLWLGAIAAWLLVLALNYPAGGRA